MMHSNRPRRVLTAALLAVLALGIGAVLGAARTTQAASTTAPSEKSPPTINGTPQEGKTLTADPGTWAGTTPITYTYQWRRCDATGGNCLGISGATSRLYDVKSQDVGHTLRVHVTATNSSGSASDSSAPTAVVTPAAPIPAPTGCPAGTGTINVAQLSPPARLEIDNFASTPTVLGRNPGNLQVRVHVSACGGRSVSGALVYVAAVPFNQFVVAPEAQTGSDGWATVTEQELSGYPADRNQQLLALFLRARKAGDPDLGGVSTRRLVSLKVNLHQ